MEEGRGWHCHRDQEKQQAELVVALGSCDSAGWGWVTWAILVGGILAGLVVIGVVAAIVSKKGYARAATSGP